MSADLLWCIIRNNNAYLRKKRDIGKPFSAEPGNLTNLSCFKNSGLLGSKSVGIVPAPDNKGFTVVMKKTKGNAVRKPAKSEIKVTMKAGPRRSLYKLKNLLRHSRYRRDLTKAAMRRASAITRSQKPVKAKKVRAAPKKAD